MNIRHRFTVILIGILFLCSWASGLSPETVMRQNPSIEDVYQKFRNPPQEARPFVRWWWSNNQLEADEILRELDLLKAAGFGGVEINPISAREGKNQSKAKILTWRSKEWDKMLLVACQGAKERGMIVDVIAGSGWPFGGEFLKPEEQIMKLNIIEEQVSGPQTVRIPISEITVRKIKEGNKTSGMKNTTLQFVQLVPENLESIDQIQDVTRHVSADGTFEMEIEPGEYTLAFGLVEHGYRTVVGGTKGAAGPCMDHMQKRVTRSYLDRLSGVEETWNEPLSTYIRAVFCDSIEMAGANWTHDILATFRERKGYDIRPFLPFVLQHETAENRRGDEMSDLIRRARYDWTEHNVHVFLNNFTAEYADFCHEHRLLSRYQAYGHPDLMGIAEGYMIPDIPESNSWLYSVDPIAEGRFTWPVWHGYMLWNKYASAGGRLNNRKIVSCEAMTNTRKTFHTTLGTIKQMDDMDFITGITHTVLHGFNYVPPDVPFPGLIRFGSFFSEYNPWWGYLPHWIEYNARLSAVFQETKPVSAIAVLAPAADVWSSYGLDRGKFHLIPAYVHKLWEPLSQLGLGCDYLHEGAIQGATFADGKMCIGPMQFEALLVVEVESLQPATAEAIRDFAKHGGKVVYVEKTPSRSPGMVDAETGDEKTTEGTAMALKAGAIKVAAPKEAEDPDHLRDWTDQVLRKAGYKADLQINAPRAGLYSLHHQAPGHELFFFANTYRKESSKTRVSFPLGDTGLWRWDPETGERSPYDHPYDATGFEIDLGPLESVLLVTADEASPVSSRRKMDGGTFAVDGPWTVEFEPVQSGKSFMMEFGELSDFTEHHDPRVKKFSGVASYKTTFRLTDSGFTKLELGWDNDFISEVTLNGQHLGINWYGAGVFDVKGALRSGENHLTIKYTTTLWNHMKRTDLQPTGLVGPVRLVRSP